MLKGRAGRDGYALFLFNLLPVYRSLEQALTRHRGDRRLAALVRPELFRTAALEADLAALAASGVRPPGRLPGGMAYAARVAAADPPRLIGHAYVRYLGDLSGGAILGRLLARSLGLGAEALNAYAFPAISEPEAFRETFRAALDAVPLDDRGSDAVLAEACLAFAHNIRLSMEVQAAAAGHGRSGGVAPPA